MHQRAGLGADFRGSCNCIILGTAADESVPRLIQYNGTDIAKKPGNMGFLAEAAHGSLFLLPGNPLWSQSSMGTAGEDCIPY